MTKETHLTFYGLYLILKIYHFLFISSYLSKMFFLFFFFFSLPIFRDSETWWELLSSSIYLHVCGSFFLVCFIFSISISMFLRQFKFLFFFCIHFFLLFFPWLLFSRFFFCLLKFFLLSVKKQCVSLSPFVIDLLLFALLFIQYILSFPPCKRIIIPNQ